MARIPLKISQLLPLSEIPDDALLVINAYGETWSVEMSTFVDYLRNALDYNPGC